MVELKFKDKRSKVRKVKSLLLSVGNHLGSAWFKKREDGSNRKMVFKLHVKKPIYAKVPSSKKYRMNRDIDKNNNQIRVFDMNKINYNKKGLMNGRGCWRTIPLENVYRIKVGGDIYRIIS